MHNRFIILLSFLISTFSSYAQVATKDVSSLVAAENYFVSLAEQKGIKEAFLKVSNDQTVVFRPDPVKAISFYKKQTNDDQTNLTWQPAMARISRGGDWGFTTGPYQYKNSETEEIAYGEYLSVWQTDKRGVWKLSLDLGVPHKKPIEEVELDFLNPQNTRYYKQYSDNRLRQRTDIVTSTDKLLSNTLKLRTELGYQEFASDDIRFLFPGYEPVTGKSSLLSFLKKHQISITTEHSITNRAVGGDMAFTYGTAVVKTGAHTDQYNYVRIWEIQEGFKWNVLLEILLPAAEQQDNASL